MSLLEIWGLIKVMGFSLSLLLGLPLGGGFYVWGVWNGEQGGITLDGYGIWEYPIPGACGIATPWGIYMHPNPMCQIPQNIRHEECHMRQYSWAGPLFPLMYVLNHAPWEDYLSGSPSMIPCPPYAPVWPMIKWP